MAIRLNKNSSQYLGIEQAIEVTTVPMIFPLDIAFLSEDMTITEVYRNIEPGYIVTSQLLVRYFLEVNAGELADIEAGVPVSVEYLAAEVVAPAESNLVSAVMPFVGFLAAGTITTLVMRDIVKGEPVFSLDPFSSYLARGLYRVLPNDSLEKVAAYGNLTGVRWLLVTWTWHTRRELHYYDRAQWYDSPSLERAYSHLVKLRCETPDGGAVLYEILHEPFESRTSVAPKAGPASFSSHFLR